MEIWKPVPGFEGYEVSDLGRVRSWISRHGRRSEPRPMKPAPDAHGYLRVTLRLNGAPVYRKVHQLVLEALVGPCPDGMEGCHNDGNRANAALTNLRWDTRPNNFADKIEHGTHHRGNRCPTSKLTEAQVKEIRKTYGPAVGTGYHSINGVTYDELASRYGVSKAAISLIVREERWEYAG